MPVTQTGRVIYQIEVDASTALRNLGNINRSTQRTATAVERLRDQARNAGIFLRNAFIGGGLIAGLTRLSREFIQVSDAAANLNARLGAAAGGPEAARDVLDDLFRVAQRLGAPLDELGSTFQKLQAAVPTAQLEQLTFSLETVVQVLTTTGAGVQATNAVLLQLSQGLGTGALRGDEFRSVFENAPQLLRAWAAALGRGEESLTKLRDEQAFTTESFITLNQEIRRLAEEAIGITEPAQTVERALQRIRNSILFLFSQQAGEGNSVLTPLIDVLNALAESVVPAVELAFASLNPIIEAFSGFVSTALSFVQDLTSVFSDLGDEFSETQDRFLPLVEGWELAFKVVLPSAVEAFANTVLGVVRTILNVVTAQFTTVVQGFLFVFERAEEAWLNFRRLFATGEVAQEYDRQIAAVEASTQARLDRISASWRRVADDAVSSLDRVLGVGNNLQNRALSLQFGREFGGAEDNLSTGGDLRLPRSIPRLGDTSGAAARAAREAERARREAQREEIALAKEMQRLREEEEDSLKKAAELQRDFTQDIRERIREEEDQIQLLRASDADRERLADQLRLEAEIRRIRAQAIEEENEFLAQQLEIIARQLEGAEGEALLGAKERRRREEEAKEAAEDQAQAYERAFGDALSGVKDLFRDIFTGGLREAEDFGARLSRILEDIIGTFVDRFLDEVFDNLAKGLAGSVTGSGGGFGGIFGSIFGSPSGFGPADYGVAPGLVGPPQQGGGFGGLSGLATSGLGFGIGSLLGSLFSDSSSGTALTSTLDPLPDVAAAANVQIINNGPPLAVESSTRRSNGDYQLIVSAAVSETRSVYERDFRRGYGGFAEAVARNTSADRTV